MTSYMYTETVNSSQPSQDYTNIEVIDDGLLLHGVHGKRIERRRVLERHVAPASLSMWVVGEEAALEVVGDDGAALFKDVGQIGMFDFVAEAAMECNSVEAALLVTGVFDDDAGTWALRVGVPPECGAFEAVNDLLFVVNKEMGFLFVTAELGLELVCPIGTMDGDVGLDRNEQLVAFETVGGVLRDGDLYG